MFEGYEIGIKLFICMIVGGIIGIERELSGHPAGFRTMILVSCGSSAFIMIGYYGFQDSESTSRIVQGIATGLGFLGAGAIIKEGLNVRGLTTAATVWTTATIGASIGMGLYNLAGMTFLITLIALSIFGILERTIDLKPVNGRIIMLYEKRKELDKVLSTFRLYGITVRKMKITKDGDGKRIKCDITIPRIIRKERLMNRLATINGITNVQWMDEFYEIQSK